MPWNGMSCRSARNTAIVFCWCKLSNRKSFMWPALNRWIWWPICGWVESIQFVFIPLICSHSQILKLIFSYGMIFGRMIWIKSKLSRLPIAHYKFCYRHITPVCCCCCCKFVLFRWSPAPISPPPIAESLIYEEIFTHHNPIDVSVGVVQQQIQFE